MALTPSVDRRSALRAATTALATTTLATACHAQEPVVLDDDLARKYKAVAKAQETMTKDQKNAYLRKLCDVGFFGPSILGALLCR
mmetsp:Transcript_12012/g.36123  ORF Transcript_12012/g.36123 Transcript_12012/m.36123 type:complete len:85 (+) Transcript_12012:1700-1954(+)